MAVLGGARAKMCASETSASRAERIERRTNGALGQARDGQLNIVKSVGSHVTRGTVGLRTEPKRCRRACQSGDRYRRCEVALFECNTHLLVP
jgi:hypothetical protein